MMAQALRILLIDDSPDDRTLALRVLEEEFPELQAREIENNQAFSKAMEDGAFDLIITDYRLRWTTGLDILRSLKDRYPDRPVIMFTGTGNEEIAVEAMKSGLDDYVLKRPNRYPYLATVVRLVLERTSTRRRAKLLEIRLQGLLNQLHVGIFRTDETGQLLECNPSFLDLLGVESLEQAQPLMQQFNLQAKYAELVHSGSPQQRMEWEIQVQQLDGTQTWVLMNATLNQVDNIAVLDGLVENITVRKEAEAALQQMYEDLEERVRERTAQLEAANQELALSNQKLEIANEDLEEFASTVSHDLQAPLRIIQGYSQLVLQDYPQELSSTIRGYIERILSNAERGRVLIHDLLNYSRLSRVELPIQSINLNSAVTEALDELKEAIQQQRAQIRVEEPLGTVRGEYRILVQVITNLVSNAIKFVLPEVQPQVRIWGERRDRFTRLWFEDNGIGITPEAQSRIFTVFERLHSDETYPGTGVGLASVRKGVERMGGQVGVESQPDEGSRFWIELPTETREGNVEEG
jgi:PAS domain S-box-containing protein